MMCALAHRELYAPDRATPSGSEQTTPHHQTSKMDFRLVHSAESSSSP